MVGMDDLLNPRTAWAEDRREATAPAGAAGTRPVARLVTGGPGTGRTRLLVRRAAEYVEAGGDPARVLLLAPTRLAADRLRDQFAEHVRATVSEPPARAWHSYAFDLLRRAQAEGLVHGVPAAPRLLAGPEQDVVIGELLEAQHQEGVPGPEWPEDLQGALRTRGFRREIREFLDRANEFGAPLPEIERLGEAHGFPQWSAAARFGTDYEAVRRLRMPEAYDPSALLHEAAALLEDQPDFRRREQERVRLLLVDDLQEATPAVLRLLEALLAGTGTVLPELVATACTDTVVQGFRGARPDLLSGLATRLPGYPGLERTELDVSHRMAPGIARAYGRVASRIPVVARALSPRRLRPVEDAADGSGQGRSDQRGTERRGTEQRAGGEAEPVVHLVASEEQELRLISQLVLEEHVHRGRSLSDMAVLVRNGGAISAVKRRLEEDGIAVEVPVAETPLREEPAVRPFLDALWLVAEESAAADLGRLMPLLTSRLGGASPSRIRRLRQSLRAAELRAGGHRSSDELILRALLPDAVSPTEPAHGTGGEGPVDPAEAVAADGVPVRGAGTDHLERVRRVLAAGRAALAGEDPSAENVLWALWSASGLAEPWERTALSGGEESDRAHRDLDAIMALFKAAERFGDQRPGAGAREFLEYLDSQDLPLDNLAARASTGPAVTLATPASAAGREWGWVHVASVQDGVWPNKTLRGSLLKTAELSEVLAHGELPAASVRVRERMRETVADELRTFATAVSRARETLVLSAVSDPSGSSDALRPSEFLALACPGSAENRDLTPVRRPLTLRGLVAELRLWAQRREDPARAEAAAEILARLARAEDATGEDGPVEPSAADSPAPVEVPGAAPEQWWGLLPLSGEDQEEAADGPRGRPVRLSPSRLEAIEKSPLDWFVSASGAEAATDLSRSLGTLVHEIAEDHPEGTEEELLEALEERFDRLGLGDGWEAEQTRARAREMLHKFALYVTDQRDRALVGVEGSFEVLVPGPARDALLAGRVDRLEVDDHGRFVIIDLKTGTSKPAAKDIPTHPQLGAYQVALDAGAGERMREFFSGREQPEQSVLELDGARLTALSGGAALVQLGDGTARTSVQDQPPLDAENGQWAVDLIQRCAELIAGHRFQARHDAEQEGAHGRPCRLPEICPLCARGRQVTQP